MWRWDITAPKRMKIKFLPVLCMVLTFLACESNEPIQQPKFELNTTSISMYVGDYKHLKIVSELEYTVECEDLYVASITKNDSYSYTYESSVAIHSEHVGKTIIRVSNGRETLTCEVEVLAKYHPFSEPFIPNYTTKSCQWLTMSNYNDSHGFEYMENASTSECAVYKGKEANVYFLYYFDSSLEIKELQMLFFDMSLWQQLYQYTKERFQYIDGEILGYDAEENYYYEDHFCNSLSVSTSTLDITLSNAYKVGDEPIILLKFVPTK